MSSSKQTAGWTNVFILDTQQHQARVARHTQGLQSSISIGQQHVVVVQPLFVGRAAAKLVHDLTG